MYGTWRSLTCLLCCRLGDRVDWKGDGDVGVVSCELALGFKMEVDGIVYRETVTVRKFWR